MMLAIAMVLIAATQEADPLAPAREGKIACVAPDRAARTCGSTISYVRNTDGSYRTTTTLILAFAPRTTMVGHADVTASAGMVCEVYRPETVDAAEVFVDGVPASDAVAGRWRAELRRDLTAYEGRKMCATYRQQGDTIVTTTTMDGAFQQGWGSTLIWVSPDDGYRLRD